MTANSYEKKNHNVITGWLWLTSSKSQVHFSFLNITMQVCNQESITEDSKLYKLEKDKHI